MEIFLKFILPPLVIGGIAGILGCLLAFLGQKMSVERDARIDEIVRFLSGANCGGCGKAGCDAFAEAIFKGEADVNDCPVTSAENKQNIARVLNLTVEESGQTVAVVHCNGGNACKDKFSYQGYGDCLSANFLSGGAKLCAEGCMGLGSCGEVCRYGAINISNDTGVSVVEPALCVSCGACVSACPKKIIGRIPADAAIYVACSNLCRGKEVAGSCKNGCIACGRCEKECPVSAIQLSNNLAAIDYSKCIKCGKCVEVCPRKCIHNFP